MMFEAIEIIKKLFSGKVVKHDGEYFTMERARLCTRPEQPVPIYVATAGPITAKRTGKLRDGIITVGAADEKIKMLWGKFGEGARQAGKDPDGDAEACSRSTSRGRRPTRRPSENALREWPNGGMPFPKQDIRNPEDFDQHGEAGPAGELQEPHADPRRPGRARAHIQQFVDMGFDEIHLHNVGRNQEEFIAAFGEKVLPAAPPGLGEISRSNQARTRAVISISPAAISVGADSAAILSIAHSTERQWPTVRLLLDAPRHAERQTRPPSPAPPPGTSPAPTAAASASREAASGSASSIDVPWTCVAPSSTSPSRIVPSRSMSRTRIVIGLEAWKPVILGQPRL